MRLFLSKVSTDIYQTDEICKMKTIKMNYLKPRRGLKTRKCWLSNFIKERGNIKSVSLLKEN